MALLITVHHWPAFVRPDSPFLLRPFRFCLPDSVLLQVTSSPQRPLHRVFFADLPRPHTVHPLPGRCGGLRLPRRLLQRCAQHRLVGGAMSCVPVHPLEGRHHSVFTTTCCRSFAVGTLRTPAPLLSLETHACRRFLCAATFEDEARRPWWADRGRQLGSHYANDAAARPLARWWPTVAQQPQPGGFERTNGYVASLAPHAARPLLQPFPNAHALCHVILQASSPQGHYRRRSSLSSPATGARDTHPPSASRLCRPSARCWGIHLLAGVGPTEEAQRLALSAPLWRTTALRRRRLGRAKGPLGS